MAAHRIDLARFGQIDCDDLFTAASQGALSLLRSEQTHPRCLCQSSDVSIAPRLVIRNLGNHCIVALWPGEAGRHAAHCRFAYPLTKPTSRGGSGDGDVWKVVIGDLSALERTKVPAARPASRVKASRASQVQPAQSLGLEAFLLTSWERSRLNEWQSGWNRDWSRVRYELQRLYVNTKVNGGAGSDAVFVVAPYRGADHSNAHAWSQWLSQLRAEHRRCLLIGECREIKTEESAQRIAIRPKHVYNVVYANDPPLGRSDRERTIRHLLDGGHVVFVAVVETTGSGFLSAGDRFSILPLDEHYRMIHPNHLAPADHHVRAHHS